MYGTIYSTFNHLGVTSILRILDKYLFLYGTIELITNRWAWALLPTKLVEPGNALAQGRRYPWQPC